MIQSKEDRIDGLINNAGIMFAPRGFTVDGIETHWSVNHLGMDFSINGQGSSFCPGHILA